MARVAVGTPNWGPLVNKDLDGIEASAKAALNEINDRLSPEGIAEAVASGAETVVEAHEGQADPHPQYLKEADADGTIAAFWTPEDNGDGTFDVPAGLATDGGDGTYTMSPGEAGIEGYTKAGADAKFAPVHDLRAFGIFAPENYGTIGSGDDTVPTQAALDAAMAAGGTVQFQANKTYSVKSLTIDFNLATAQSPSGAPYGFRAPIILGGYRGTIIQQIATAAVGENLFTVQGKIGTSAGPGSNNKVTGLVIQGLELVGRYTAGVAGDPTGVVGGDGLVIRSAFDCEFDRLVIRNMPGNGLSVKRLYFQSGVNDEYAYDLRFKGIRSLVNGGYGFQFGSSAGAAVTANIQSCDATSNRLGGFLLCPTNMLLQNCYSGGNKSFGFRTVWTNQSPGSPQNVSTTAGCTFVACRSEGTLGYAEFDLQGGSGISLVGCQTFATSGAHCIAIGAGQTGISMHRPFISGGYYSGDASSPGQLFLVANPGGLLATAAPGGSAITSLTLQYPVTLPTGASLVINNGTVSETVTTSSAVTNSTTVPITSYTPTATFGVGSYVIAQNISDAQNPKVEGSRVDYGTFGPGPGGRTLPNSLVFAGNLSWIDSQNLIASPSGYLDFARKISTPGNATSGRMRMYIKDNGSGKTQLAVRFPSGVEQIIATEP